MGNLTLELAVDPPQASKAAALIGEPSLSDVLEAIAADPAIDTFKRRHWLSSIRRIAEGIGRPPGSLPARLTALRHPIARLSAAQMRIEQKTLANHRSNVIAAVNYFFAGRGGPQRGALLKQRIPL
jgi:hypothetical protein